MESISFFDETAITKAVCTVLTSYHGQGFFPSASVRVFAADRTLCTETVGDVRAGTVFDVASLTKLATATQVLQLVADGKLGLGDGILDRLPYLAGDALLCGRLADVTLYALLTHTSGIVDWYPFYAHREKPFAKVLALALARYGPVSGMVYSDLNFMLLGKVLEAVRDMPLEDCLQETLVRPLGLGRMTYRPDPAWDIAPSSFGNPIEEAMCRERGIAFDGWRPHEALRGEANDGNAYYYFGGVAGSAGIFAEPEAYERLCRFYMTAEAPVFGEAQRALEPTRGLGWQVSDMYPEGCGHTGFTGTSVYLSRSLGVGVIAFTNRLYMTTPREGGIQEFRKALHEAVAGAVRANA